MILVKPAIPHSAFTLMPFCRHRRNTYGAMGELAVHIVAKKTKPKIF